MDISGYMEMMQRCIQWKWKCFLDYLISSHMQVKPVSSVTVLNQDTAYILFYELEGIIHHKSQNVL